MKELFETIFSAMKTWQAGAVLCLSVTGNIYLALWNRELTEKSEAKSELVIAAKTELNRVKSERIAELEDENANLRRALRDTAR